MKTPNEYLKECRIKKGLTQSELAKKLKVHVQFVSNVERGACGVPRKRLKKWVKLVDAKPQEYMHWTMILSEGDLRRDLGL